MKLLAIETSTPACSAALFIDGEIYERFEIAPKAHTQLLLPMIDSLMADAGLRPQQLDALAFSRGPGSFTGVRISTGVIQGIAFGADLPVVPISTLAAMAQDFFMRHPIDTAFVALDARIEEVFWGIYQRNSENYAILSGTEIVCPPSKITIPEIAGAGIGSGWAVYEQLLTERLSVPFLTLDTNCLPRASAIARLGAYGFSLGQAVSAEQAMPVYLRDKVAKTESERMAEKCILG